jgi:hypothetical protein
MKASRLASLIRYGLFAGISACLVLSASAYPAPRSDEGAGYPRSVFVTGSRLPDPFHPNFKKKEKEKSVIVEDPIEIFSKAGVSPESLPPDASTYLTLKGVLGSRLVLINTTLKTHQFLQGDSFRVNIPDYSDKAKTKSIQVHCIEINDGSVTLDVDDGQKSQRVNLKLENN